jgi:hypothetical protein
MHDQGLLTKTCHGHDLPVCAVNACDHQPAARCDAPHQVTVNHHQQCAGQLTGGNVLWTLLWRSSRSAQSGVDHCKGRHIGAWHWPCTQQRPEPIQNTSGGYNT